MSKPSKDQDNGPTCAACLYFAPDEDSGGDCYANPPTVLTDGEDIASVRPWVAADAKPCRHFKAKQ